MEMVLMVEIEATTTIVIAVSIFVVWRVVLWLRGRGDPVREAGIVALTAWGLLLVAVTFFPLLIIFYDWAGTSNFVPLASIGQLIRETSLETAITNIGGNLVLLAPFGFLMPLLFTRMRSLWATTWRAAVVSLAIEVGQSITGARASDIDDIILNTAGAMAGYLIYRGFELVLEHWTAGRTLLTRFGSTTTREPLLLAWLPMLLTVAIAVPLVLSAVFDATLDDRGIVEDAVSLSTGGEVVARADLPSHAFLVVRNDGTAPATLALTAYERLPLGRFTRTVWSDPVAEVPSAYSYSITEFDTTREAGPTIVVWGSNRAGATKIELVSGATTTSFGVSDAAYFVDGAFIPADATASVLDMVITFFDATGRDITGEFGTY